VVKESKFSHITPILRSPYWLKIREPIEYKLHSFTYKVLTISQPDTYTILSLFSLQEGRTRSCCCHPSSIRMPCTNGPSTEPTSSDL